MYVKLKSLLIEVTRFLKLAHIFWEMQCFSQLRNKGGGWLKHQSILVVLLTTSKKN